MHELGGKKRQDATGSGQNRLNHPYAKNDYYMYDVPYLILLVQSANSFTRVTGTL